MRALIIATAIICISVPAFASYKDIAKDQADIAADCAKLQAKEAAGENTADVQKDLANDRAKLDRDLHDHS